MKILKLYALCRGQAREFKDNPINAPVEYINVIEEPEIANKI